MRVMDQENQLKRYLLNDLPGDQREAVEDRYLADREWFDRLQVAEDDLVDAYVQGRLTARERALFEQNYMCIAEHRRRVELARALMAYTDARAAARPPAKVSLGRRFARTLRLDSPAVRWVLATGFMLALVGGPFMAWRLSRLSAELDSLRAEQRALQQREQELSGELAQQRSKAESLTDELAQEKQVSSQQEQELEKLREAQSPQPSVVYSFGNGGEPLPGQAETLEIPRGAQTVRLQMPLLEDRFQTYLVTIKDAQAKEVWQGWLQATHNASGSSVMLRLPARLLNAGRYSLTLSGTNDRKNFEELAAYELRVVRK